MQIFVGKLGLVAVRKLPLVFDIWTTGDFLTAIGLELNLNREILTLRQINDSNKVSELG